VITYSDTPQGTDEWLAERAGLLTASNAKKMMAGKTTATYRGYVDDLWEARVHGYIPDNGYVSAAMIEGNEREPEARAALAWHINQDIAEVGLATNDAYPGAGASLDGLIKGCIGVEIKVRRVARIKDWKDHQHQITFQMMICDLEAVYYWGYPKLYPNAKVQPEPFLHIIERDEDKISAMRARYLETNELINKYANQERERNA